MAGASVEFVLMLGYAVFLAFTAFLLEWAARHAHRRSMEASTAGFTYHPERDIWRCPQDQHLFPVFSDFTKGTVIYRASASTCNACKSKSACTDSSNGRQVERQNLNGLEYGMQRFHRAMSLTLLALASLIVVIELFRADGLYPRITLISALTVFSIVAVHLHRQIHTGSSAP